ncbi:MAG: iron-sulfur cluster assembly protein [Candidatus Ranarchaeia archaeon]
MVDKTELLEILRKVKDPELPLSIMDPQLNVVTPDLVEINEVDKEVFVQFKPTIPTCPMGGMIGLVIKKVLVDFAPKDWKVKVSIFPGAHIQEEKLNDMINDEQQYTAAIKNLIDKGYLKHFELK